jgi:hypothetical protein
MAANGSRVRMLFFALSVRVAWVRIIFFRSIVPGYGAAQGKGRFIGILSYIEINVKP